MDERTGHLLTAQWFLLILPLCIAGMALYPSFSVLLFYPSERYRVTFLPYSGLLTVLLVFGCIGTAMTAAVWFKTRLEKWRLSSGHFCLSSVVVGGLLATVVPFEWLYAVVGRDRESDGEKIVITYFYAPMFGRVFFGMLMLGVLLIFMSALALRQQKVIYPLPGQAPYQHPVPTYPAPHQVEVPTPSTSPRHLHIGNPGGTLPPA